jgi:8-oxo-dGTP diphosphatase
MLRVVAAVIEHDGRILIGQRPPGKSHPLEWEFPGGKVEAGESLKDALARELREELQIDAEIGKEIDRYLFGYANQKPIELIFFEVEAFKGEPVNCAFHEIRWVRREELREHEFLEGDRQFIARLMGEEPGDRL